MLRKASVNLGTSKLYRDLLAVMITYLETPKICCRRRTRHLSFKYHKSEPIKDEVLKTHYFQHMGIRLAVNISRLV